MILESGVAFSQALIGARVGRLILTNHRLFWQENVAWMLWPFKRISGQLNLSDIVSVDKGPLFEFVFGGRRLRLRLRNGKNKCFYADRLDEWIETIRRVIAKAEEP